MTDYEFPELPSDDELGITEADREEYEKDLPDDAGEMSDKELAALLGDSPAKADKGATSKGQPASASKRGAEKQKVDKKAARAARAAEKQRAKEEKRRAKEAKQQAREAKKATKEAAPTAAGAGAANQSAPPASDTKESEPSDERKKPAPAGPAIAEGPRSRWRGPASLVALIAVCFVASSRTGMPRPVPANAPDTVFSSSRAMSTLIEVAREAHPPGSPEHARVRELLVDRLRALGLEPEVQTTTSLIERADYARSATVRNIVARIPGTAPSGTILITAHYDSREIAVGASDDGSGVVTIIEALRALQEGEPLANDLIVLLTDAEELGLLGARAFVDQHRWMEDVDIVLSFEMRGGGGPSIMFETNENNGWVARAYRDFDPSPFANSLSHAVYQRLPNDTDFTPFKEAGVQGLNFAAIDNAHVYHQVYDTPDNLDESTLQHHGLHALAALRFFGEEDLSNVDAPNVVYFSLPVVGLIVYPESLVLPLSGLVVLLLGILVVVGRRGGARPLRSAFGFGLSLVAGGIVFGLAVALLRWLPDFHAEGTSLMGSIYHSEGWYVVTLAFASLAVVTALTALSRRWVAPIELATGALVLPVVAAVAASIFAPLGAMNLQWPAMAGLVSAILLALLGSRSDGNVGWVTALLLAVPVILFVEPLIELLWLAMTVRLGGVLGVLMVMGLFLSVPALESLRHPNSWWVPATGTVLAAVCLGLGLLTARPNAERPTPSTLVYAYEHGSGSAVWATSAVGADADDPSDARIWAVERAGADFPETRDLSDFGYRMGIVPVTRATVTDANPPEVRIVTDSVVQSERQVTLSVRSRIGAEMLGFQFGEGTRLMSLNGFAVAGSETIRQADHWGEPESSILVEVTLPADEPMGVHIIEHLLRPETLLGENAFARPAAMAPDVNRMSDRAMFRYSVAAFVDPRHAIVPLEDRPPEPAVVQPDSEAADTVAADTMATDTVAADTATADTVVVDTTQAALIAVDTTGMAAIDTVRADTLVIDTMRADTTVIDTMRADTTVIDTLRADTPESDTLGGLRTTSRR